MARSRNIKPGFFTNDDLGEMDPLARLLFAGMWTIADREGRLEDRPKKIKAEVLPYDNCDAEAFLVALAQHGFIQRYEVGGKRYIQVLAWGKHQNPHCKEAASTIPAPEGYAATTVQEHAEHGASTVQAPCAAQPLPERAGLIPDSLNLIPDSSPLIPVGEAVASAPPRKRGAKVVPDDFTVTHEMAAWARATYPAVDLMAQTAAFRDHEFKDSKTDWVKAWRNWIRRSDVMPHSRASPQGKPPTAAQMAMAQACPTLVSPHMQQYVPQPIKPIFAEVVDADSRLLD